jgi:hypothetical protein
MPLELCVPTCIGTPAHAHHPPLEKPLRISIEGPQVAIEKLLLRGEWYVEHFLTIFPRPAGPEPTR